MTDTEKRTLFGWCMTGQHEDCIIVLSTANYSCNCTCHTKGEPA